MHYDRLEAILIEKIQAYMEDGTITSNTTPLHSSFL